MTRLLLSIILLSVLAVSSHAAREQKLGPIEQKHFQKTFGKSYHKFPLSGFKKAGTEKWFVGIEAGKNDGVKLGTEAYVAYVGIDMFIIGKGSVTDVENDIAEILVEVRTKEAMQKGKHFVYLETLTPHVANPGKD